jgi:hypothetical protein
MKSVCFTVLKSGMLSNLCLRDTVIKELLKSP